MAKQKIDFVITWVNGADPKWKQEKDNCMNKFGLRTQADDRKERYRDWDILRYWFRGIENFAPWVRKIHFVTWGHLPEWLNTNHPKLNIVNHFDYIPQKYLPTFNSHTIEWNFHRIKNLSDKFVYFNDDVFLLNTVKPTDFFVHNKPVDMLALQPDVANADDTVMPYIYLNNAMVLAKYFDKRENIRKQPLAYFHPGYPLMYLVNNALEMAFPRFTGFYTVHGPAPLMKQTYETLWRLEPELLDHVCSHPFRHKEDVNQYVLREYEKLNQNFVPRNVKKFCQYYDLDAKNDKLISVITGQKCPAVCINDSNHSIPYKRVKRQLDTAFGKILPDKSSFEI